MDKVSSVLKALNKIILSLPVPKKHGRETVIFSAKNDALAVVLMTKT